MLRGRLSCSSKWWLGLLAVLLVAGMGCGGDSGGGSSGGSNPKFNEFLYVTNQGDDVVSEFSINRHSGALSPIGTAPVTAGVAAGATGITVTPDFDLVYVTNVNNAEVYGFVINTDGTLTPTQQGDIVVNDGAANPTRLTADSTGAFLYVLDAENDQVFAYSIGDGGTLTLIPPQVGEQNPIPTGSIPSGIASVNALSGVSVNAIYVTNEGDGTISQYAVNSDGTLSAIGSPVDSLGADSPGAPTDIVIPGPQDAYVSDQSGGTGGVVSHFTIGSDGSLTFSASTGTGNTTQGSFPNWITAALSTEKVFTSNILEVPLGATSNANAQQALESNNLSGFKLNSDGSNDLVQTSLTSFDGIPEGLSSDVIGKFLYVPNLQNGTVSQYVINGKKGTLNPIGSGSVDTETPNNPNSNPLQAASAILPIVSK